MKNDQFDRDVQQFFAALLAGFAVGASTASLLGNTLGIIAGVALGIVYFLVARGGPGIMEKPYTPTILALVAAAGITYVLVAFLSVPLPLGLAVGFVAFNGAHRRARIKHIEEKTDRDSA